MFATINPPAAFNAVVSIIAWFAVLFNTLTNDVMASSLVLICMSSKDDLCKPTTSGSIAFINTLSFFNMHTRLTALVENSSMPSSERTVIIFSAPFLLRINGNLSKYSVEKTPTSWFFTPAGFDSGPNRLNAVLFSNCFLAAETCFIAG